MALTADELNDIRMQARPATEATAAPTAETLPGAATSQPTAEEIQSEMGTGFKQGIARGLTIGAGGLTGLRFGAAAAAGAPATAFGAVTAPFLPAIGFLGGTYAGSKAAELVDELYPGVSRQDLIPYREGAKITGESIAMSPFVFGIPALQGGRVAQFVTEIGTAARKNPARFLTGEALSSIGAGIGGGTAEAVAPGSAGARFTGEVGGSILFPGKLFINLGGALYDYGKGAIAGQKFDAKEAKVAETLRKIIVDSGEDVNKLIRSLEMQLPRDVTPTSAQKTGSAALSVVENTLAV